MGSEWKRVLISDVCELIVDCVNKTAPTVETPTDFKMIRTPNIKSGRVNTEHCRYVNEDTFIKWTRRADIRMNDVLLTREAPLGEVGIVTKSENLFLGQRIMQYRADTKQLDPHFLLYSFLSLDLQNQFLMHEGSGSVVSHIRVGDCSKFELNLPILQEQKKIVGVLKSIDDTITLNHQINQILEEMAQTLFKSWFVDFDPVLDNALDSGNPIPEPLQAKADARQAMRARDDFKPLPNNIRELFPSEFEESELGWIPKGWEVKGLDEIANYQNGLALQNFRPKGDDFLPVLKIAQLKKGFADSEEKASPSIKPEYIVDNGDVVFSWSGSLMVDIWCGGQVALNQHLFKVTSKRYPKCFFYYYTKQHLAEFQRIAAAKAVTMGHIKREHLSKAMCIIPPISLLKEGDKLIGSLLNNQIEQRLENNYLANIRDTLLPKLISGEIKVSEE